MSEKVERKFYKQNPDNMTSGVITYAQSDKEKTQRAKKHATSHDNDDRFPREYQQMNKTAQQEHKTDRRCDVSRYSKTK